MNKYKEIEVEVRENAFTDRTGVISVCTVFQANGSVEMKNVLALEFINLSNVPVLINNSLFLDRYYAGAVNNPTYLNTFYRWKPLIIANERDTANYGFTFLKTFYTGVTAAPRLMVIRKLWSPASTKEQF